MNNVITSRNLGNMIIFSFLICLINIHNISMSILIIYHSLVIRIIWLFICRVSNNMYPIVYIVFKSHCGYISIPSVCYKIPHYFPVSVQDQKISDAGIPWEKENNSNVSSECIHVTL